MEIIRAAAREAMAGPSDWFTGSVEVEMLFNPFDAERVQGASVTFQPGARTACTPIRSARRCSSPQAKAGCSVGAARSR